MLRSELTPLPRHIAKLPVHRGYPVPWFVAWLDDAGEPVAAGQGTPEFRVIARGAIARAVKSDLCWICGGKIAPRSARAFVVGAMCAVNRVSAEPPSHLVCARWAAINCPFLARPTAKRREGGLPAGAIDPAGIMLKRNPGVGLLWISRNYAPRRAGGGVLFDMGEPDAVEWYAHGRIATRAEAEESLESGMPSLRELAGRTPGGLEYLEQEAVRARAFLPT